LNAIFPALCRTCKAGLEPPFDESRICPDCLKKIRTIDQPVCPTCGISLRVDALSPRLKTCDFCPPTKIHFEQARARLEYEGVTAELIKLLKYRYKKDILPLLVDYMLQAYEEYYKDEPFEVVIPVPLHWTRLRNREFNQAELLACALGGTIGLEVDLRNLGLAPLEVRGRILETGVRIYCSNEPARVANESRLLSVYHDRKTKLAAFHEERLAAFAAGA